MLTHGISADEDEMIVAELPEMRISLGGENDFTDSYKFFREFIRFCQTLHKPRLNQAYPIGGYPIGYFDIYVIL
ncbi:MAG: hypothetical protein LBD23_19050 [Oscillospiraceae bacterium]|nr:hypothetical protein [Oscillospiraceae bacterium]